MDHAVWLKPYRFELFALPLINISLEQFAVSLAIRTCEPSGPGLIGGSVQCQLDIILPSGFPPNLLSVSGRCPPCENAVGSVPWPKIGTGPPGELRNGETYFEYEWVFCGS